MGDKNPRAAAKRDKQRLAMAPGGSAKKRAVASPVDPTPLEKPFRFRFDRVDVGSSWCLTEISKEDHAALLAFMATVENLKLKEVIPAMCKREDVAGDSPNPDAQRRARDQFPDDHDRIHSLHMTGAKRIWGLQFDNEFSVIWWDPDHQVWPTRRVYEN